MEEIPMCPSDEKECEWVDARTGVARCYIDTSEVAYPEYCPHLNAALVMKERRNHTIRTFVGGFMVALGICGVIMLAFGWEVIMYKYKEVKPIDSYLSTVWLVHDNTKGVEILEVWHEKAQIEDVVNAYRATHPGNLFVVYALDVGSFEMKGVIASMHNGRGVDQSMNVYVE